MVNIREFSAEELRSVIEKSIDLLSQEEVVAPVEPAKEEEWQNEDGHILTLISEDDMWNVYAGVNLDGTFNSYPEAAEYLDEEGFHANKNRKWVSPLSIFVPFNDSLSTNFCNFPLALRGSSSTNK